MKIYYLFNIFFYYYFIYYLVNQSTEKYTSTNYQTDYIYLSLVSICIKLNMVFTPQKFNLNEILMSRFDSFPVEMKRTREATLYRILQLLLCYFNTKQVFFFII